jgi:hypothetical protein
VIVDVASAGITEGVTEYTSAAATYKKLTDSAEEVPKTSIETKTLPGLLFGGTTQVTCVEFEYSAATFVMFPPKRHTLSATKLTPLTVTLAPPVVRPIEGCSADTDHIGTCSNARDFLPQTASSTFMLML